MGDQRTFASVAWEQKGKVTRSERFLAEMDAVIPWQRLMALIEPHYPKAGNGRQPLGLEMMLRIYFLQQWFNLSEPAAEDAIYDSESMRRFARVSRQRQAVTGFANIDKDVVDEHLWGENLLSRGQRLMPRRIEDELVPTTYSPCVSFRSSPCPLVVSRNYDTSPVMIAACNIPRPPPTSAPR
jgi:transposase, IS5 family